MPFGLAQHPAPLGPLTPARQFLNAARSYHGLAPAAVSGPFFCALCLFFRLENQGNER